MCILWGVGDVFFGACRVEISPLAPLGRDDRGSSVSRHSRLDRESRKDERESYQQHKALKNNIFVDK